MVMGPWMASRVKTSETVPPATLRKELPAKPQKKRVWDGRPGIVSTTRPKQRGKRRQRGRSDQVAGAEDLQR